MPFYGVDYNNKIQVIANGKKMTKCVCAIELDKKLHINAEFSR